MILRYSPTGIGPYGGDYPDERPRKRGECMTMPRPCPFVSCKHHTAIDGHTRKGPPGEQKRIHLRIMVPGGTEDEIAESIVRMHHTCVLDIADGYGGDMGECWVGVPDEVVEHVDVMAAALNMPRRTVEVTLEKGQRRLGEAMKDAQVDYNMQPTRPYDRRGEPERFLLEALSSGPRERERLIVDASVRGISQSSIDGAARRMRAKNVMTAAGVKRKRATWSLVGGRQATHRDRGLPDETGGSGRTP